MFRTLLSMLNDRDYLSEVRESLSSLKQACTDTLSSFEEEGDSYVMTLNVPEGLKSSDVSSSDLIVMKLIEKQLYKWQKRI